MTRAKKAFSLIDIAIVMGVIGLVIGGIWSGAAAVRSHMRISEASAAIVTIAQTVRVSIPAVNYPTTVNTTTSATQVVGVSSNASFFKWNPATGHLSTPSGAFFTLVLGCYGSYPSSTCPMFSVRMIGTSQAAGNKITGDDCLAIMRKTAGLAKDGSDFLYIQLLSATAATQFFYPPIDMNALNCPSDFTQVMFWFRAS